MNDSDEREIHAREAWREIFAPDAGTLLDLRVFGVSAEDYRALLAMVVSRFCARYMRDGVEGDVPTYETILRDCGTVSVYVKSSVAGVQINLWFWSESELELDLLPDDVDSEPKANGILRFVSEVSRLLKKPVLLTGENATADEQWAQTHCILRAEPPNGNVEFRC